MQTEWIWTGAVFSIIFSLLFTIKTVMRLVDWLDYSDTSYFQDQKAFNRIINNYMYLSFKYAKSVRYEGGTTTRRLRGYEVDQLLDCLIAKEFESRLKELNKLKDNLAKAAFDEELANQIKEA